MDRMFAGCAKNSFDLRILSSRRKNANGPMDRKKKPQMNADGRR